MLLGAAFSFMMYGFSAWFTEFLPTYQRGPMYVSLTAGYPMGRAIAIVTAWALQVKQWRFLELEAGVGLAIATLIAFTIPESPRILQLKGDTEGAFKARPSAAAQTSLAHF